jgi:hypothetical protein
VTRPFRITILLTFYARRIIIIGMTPNEFNAWLAAMKISGAEAARLLGVTPNTITRYRRAGAPRSVGLACAALFHRLGEWK